MQDTITKPLLKWYGENKRVLPWREKKNPYEIWVSEIMLQQTRTDTVSRRGWRRSSRFMSGLCVNCPMSQHLRSVPRKSF